MNKNKSKLHLIVIFLVFIAAGLLYFLFFSSKKIDFKGQPEVRRLNGFPTTVFTEKQLEKMRAVITNEEELAKFLNSVDESGYLIVRESIDFEKEFILGVSSSTNEETGHEIRIKKLYEDKEDGSLLVSIRETEPGELCEVEKNMNVAIDLVAISKTDYEIEFERVKHLDECE